MIVTFPGHLLCVLCPPAAGSSRAYNVMSLRAYVYVYFQVYIQVYIDIYVRVSLGGHNLGTY